MNIFVTVEKNSKVDLPSRSLTSSPQKNLLSNSCGKLKTLKIMKEILLSNNERAFIEDSIKEGLRIDQRQLNEFRDLEIVFVSKELGSVVVSLGNTKVFACVSCEVSTPKTSRPNEGTIFVNVELGPMAAPHFESSVGSGGNLNEACIFVNRILERTIRDSRCIDMESLCIIAEEKVWNLRVDITVLNHEGNIAGRIMLIWIIKIIIFF